MRVLSALLRLLLALLALALGALALGAFASLNPGAPTWMRTLGAAEGLLLGQVLGRSFQTGPLQAGPLQSGEWRGFILAGLSALSVFLAAWPRAERAVPSAERFSDQNRLPGGPPPPGRP